MFTAALVAIGCSQPAGPNSSAAPAAGGDAEFGFSESQLSGSALVTSLTGLTAEQQQDGVLSLFDGESLFGWQTENLKGDWKVQDNAIVCDEGEPDLLLTAVPFADFELTLEFKIDAGGNSGVFVRTAESIESVGRDTYEVNIAAEHPQGFTTGSIVDRIKATGVNAGDDGQWHTMRIVCDGARVQTFVDGDDAVDLLQTEDSPGNRKVGYIGLQHRTGAVAFRRIYLRPLNLQPELLSSLDGWKVIQQVKKDGTVGEASFEPVDNGVHVTSGLGFLVSDATYQDFIVRFTAETNAYETNSGLFFRNETATPEAPSNGYELQIHNGYDGERSKANNGGTGGIFRRAEARLVPADDFTPATVTLVADGDRFVSWVNGYAVMDWTDKRENDPNPRRGRRLEAGQFAIQAHDPTTDVTITDFGVLELPEM